MIGDCVYDMHNGIHKFPFKVISHIRIDLEENQTDLAIKFIEQFLTPEATGKQHRKVYGNKFVYITGEKLDAVQAMYCYDGMWFGIIEFEPPE